MPATPLSYCLPAAARTPRVRIGPLEVERIRVRARLRVWLLVEERLRHQRDWSYTGRRRSRVEAGKSYARKNRRLCAHQRIPCIAACAWRYAATCFRLASALLLGARRLTCVRDPACEGGRWVATFGLRHRLRRRF